MLEKCKEKLSILTCNYYFNGFQGKQTVEVDGEKLEVYLFKGFYSGLSTIWSDILLNERYLEEGMEKVRRRVLLHELQHRKENTLLQAIGGGLQILLYPPILGLSLTASLLLSIDVLLQPTILDPVTSYLNSGKTLLYLFLVYCLSSISSQLSELKTSLEVVKKMGPKEYRESWEKAKETSKERGLLGKISVRLSHPSTPTVLKMYRIIYDNQSS